MRYWLAVAGAVAILGEAIARSLGFGTPPLSVTHPTIEYLFAPNQNLRRFHNRVQINQWGMRSAPVEKTKGDPAETRILALGDSVLNGGALTDQSDLATTLLSKGNTRVLNASAGSWGPPNLLAYVREFGLFDADIVVIVLSSHDAFDVPTFASLNPSTHPTQAPISALYEAVTSYLPRYLPLLSATTQADNSLGDALPAIKNLLTFSKTPVCVVLHASRSERTQGYYGAGGNAIQKLVLDAGVTLVADRDFLNETEAYRDDIHLSRIGQQQLAHAIATCLGRGT